MKKRDLSRLQDLSNELERGLSLLMADDYSIMKRSSLTSSDMFTSSYYPNDKYARIAKDYGNDLVPMFTAIKSISKLLNPETQID